MSTLVVTFQELSEIDLSRLGAGFPTPLDVVDVWEMEPPSVEMSDIIGDIYIEITASHRVTSRDIILCVAEETSAVQAVLLYSLLERQSAGRVRIAWLRDKSVAPTFSGDEDDHLLDLFDPENVLNDSYRHYSHT